MKRWIVSTGLAVALIALAALAAPAEAKHRKNDWGYGWQQGWQQGWQPGWNPGWNQDDDWDDDDWDDDDWDNGWGGGRGVVPPGQIAKELRRNGFSDIKEIILDDDGEIYKVRVRNPDGRFVRLFYDAHTGRFLKRQFLR